MDERAKRDERWPEAPEAGSTAAGTPRGGLPSGGLSRRGLLGALPWVAGALAASGATTASAGGGSATRDRLVLIFLRGGADALALVPPWGDPDHAATRPTLGVPPPGSGPDAAIDLDGFFGLAPSLAPLVPAWQAGDLCIVQAAGSPQHIRSHFEAEAIVEEGRPLLPPGTTRGGFLARHLERVPPLSTVPFRGLALEHVTPRSLRGVPGTVAFRDPTSADFPGYPVTADERREALDSMFAREGGLLGDTTATTLASISLLEGVDFEGYVPANGAVYPASNLGGKLRTVATLYRAGADVEVAEIDVPEWDVHANAGPLRGRLAELGADLAASLAAFHSDLGTELDRTTVVVMSEFGRRAAENGSAGFDHGFGGVMFLLGGGIAGGQVIADPWPGLAPESLVEGDLEVTADYRDILGEVLVRRCGLALDDLAAVFPGLRPRFRGVTV